MSAVNISRSLRRLCAAQVSQGQVYRALATAAASSPKPESLKAAVEEKTGVTTPKV
jgi:adenylosuccinate lyase